MTVTEKDIRKAGATLLNALADNEASWSQSFPDQPITMIMRDTLRLIDTAVHHVESDPGEGRGPLTPAVLVRKRHIVEMCLIWYLTGYRVGIEQTTERST